MNPPIRVRIETEHLSIEGEISGGAREVLTTGPRDPHKRLVVENAMVRLKGGPVEAIEELSVYMGHVEAWWPI